MAYERLSRGVYRFSARLSISTYQLHAGMIFTMLFLPKDKKFSQKVLKTPWKIISNKCLPWHENSTLFFENSSENFFVKLHWQANVLCLTHPWFRRKKNMEADGRTRAMSVAKEKAPLRPIPFRDIRASAPPCLIRKSDYSASQFLIIMHHKNASKRKSLCGSGFSLSALCCLPKPYHFGVKWPAMLCENKDQYISFPIELNAIIGIKSYYCVILKMVISRRPNAIKTIQNSVFVFFWKRKKTCLFSKHKKNEEHVNCFLFNPVFFRSRTVQRRRFGDAGSALRFRRRDVSAMVVANVLCEKNLCFWNTLKVRLQRMFAS